RSDLDTSTNLFHDKHSSDAGTDGWYRRPTASRSAANGTARFLTKEAYHALDRLALITGSKPSEGRLWMPRHTVQPGLYFNGTPTLHVIQHTDRNLLSWRIRGIRSTASAFASMAGRDAPVVRSSTSKSGRVCRARYRHGCAMPRRARR